MDEIVFKYLNLNYRFSLSSFHSFMLKSRRGGKDIKLSDLLDSLKTIFSLSDEKIYKIFEKWADSQTILMNNRIVSIQERLHRLGFSTELSASQLKTIMDDEDEIRDSR